jgi:hypothetical protein
VNIDENMSDNETLHVVAGSLSTLPVPDPPEAKAVMARGRTRRHRRRAGIGTAGAAAAVALALGLASAFFRGPAPPPATETIRTTAFTLVKSENGSVTLTLTQGQMLNPNALQRALAQDGIPALVKIGTQCSSVPAPAGSPNAILSVQLPDGRPVTGPPGASIPIPPNAVNVINPKAIPAGTGLFFDYLNNDHDLAFSLINIHSYTCTSDAVP